VTPILVGKEEKGKSSDHHAKSKPKIYRLFNKNISSTMDMVPIDLTPVRRLLRPSVSMRDLPLFYKRLEYLGTSHACFFSNLFM
jgi:hypothetical protein